MRTEWTWIQNVFRLAQAALMGAGMAAFAATIFDGGNNQRGMPGRAGSFQPKAPFLAFGVGAFGFALSNTTILSLEKHQRPTQDTEESRQRRRTFTLTIGALLALVLAGVEVEVVHQIWNTASKLRGLLLVVAVVGSGAALVAGIADIVWILQDRSESDEIARMDLEQQSYQDEFSSDVPVDGEGDNLQPYRD